MSSEFEAMLADDMGRFFYDPLGFVMYAFEWGAGELDGFDGPDEWQKEFLTDWGEAIRTNNFDGVKPVEAYRCATSSGHGIGKSALTAWVILYIMSTRPFCKGVVTANTSEQLRTKTWGELGKWKKRCITGHWFEYNNGKGNMNIYHVDHMESWRCDGQTCREENSESFAG
ncbi:terminase, partial [Salmonella enterica subsp. enterica serovar Chester]|nr:terminase [Salmonella enterica subsp. enterica serovar Chester]